MNAFRRSAIPSITLVKKPEAAVSEGVPRNADGVVSNTDRHFAAPRFAFMKKR